MSIGRPGTSAFSLIEMLVVVSLIAILTALVVPELKGTYQGALLRSACRELVAVSNLAYSQAVTSRRAHVLRIDPTSRRYWLEAPRAPGLAWGSSGGFEPVTGVPGSAGEIGKGISVAVRGPGEAPSSKGPAPRDSGPQHEGRAEAIRFLPDGTADSREIELEDEDGFRVVLRIDHATSRVRVTESGRRARQ